MRAWRGFRLGGCEADGEEWGHIASGTIPLLQMSFS